MMRSIEQGEEPLLVPSSDKIEIIESRDALTGRILRELYLSAKMIWSDQIEIRSDSSEGGKVVAIKALYSDGTDLNVRDIRFLNGMSDNLLAQAENKIKSLPLDVSLILKSFGRLCVASSYYPGLTHAAMEVIGQIKNPHQIVGARIAHPIDFEINFRDQSPRRIGNQFAQFLLSQAPIYRQ